MNLPALHELNYYLKATISIFLICITFGMLQGQAYLMLVMSDSQQKALPVLDSISKHYYVPPVPILKHAIDGSMKDEVETDEDRKILEEWMEAGAPKQMYDEQVREIIERSCIDCHSPGGEAEFSDFEDFENLQKLAVFSYKPYIKKRLRMAHPHMLTIPLYILPTVLLLSLTHLSSSTKMGLMTIPLLGILIDVTGWFITMVTPSAAVLVLVGGILCHVGTYVAIALNFYYLWFFKTKRVFDES